MTAKRSQAAGAKAVRGSDAARRKAALMLEAWSGVRSTQSASEAMGVALTRFYQLEARALQLIVSAMEPRPRGRQVTPESELAKLRAANQRLARDVERYQTLYRTSQRALGVVIAKGTDEKKNPGARRKRGPRQKARGQAVAAVLAGDLAAEGGAEVSGGATEQGSGSRGRSGGRRGVEGASAGDPEHAER